MKKLFVIAILFLGAVMASPTSAARGAGETLSATPNPVAVNTPVTINGSGFHSGWSVQIEYARPSAGSFSVFTTADANGNVSDIQSLNETGNWTVCSIVQQGRPRLGPCVLVTVN